MPELGEVAHQIRASSRPVGDRAVARLAAKQYGVIGAVQLTALGLGRGAIAQRVAAGRLHPLHRGVYAVGHRYVQARGHWLAAVLACGPGAVLSHRSAAELLDLRAAARARVDVTVPRHRGRHLGIDVHRSRCLPVVDITHVEGIPCTTVARTLADLAAVVAPHALRRAWRRAEILRLLDVAEVERKLARGKGHRGIADLRALLDEAAEPPLTRSELEERFLNICRAAGLPMPLVNHCIPVRGRRLEADFLWEEQRLVAETDGWGAHGTRSAFESDRLRDADLLVEGLRVVRFSWRQVVYEPGAVAQTLSALLA